MAFCPFKFDLCAELELQMMPLKRHIESVHEGKKHFKCKICDASFSQKVNMNEHIALVHEGNEPF